MDLKQYFKKLRDMEAKLVEEFYLLISNETADGGKAGVVCEVCRTDAARLLVDGKALLASEEEKEVHRQQQLRARKQAEAAELAKRVQFAVIAEPESHPATATRKNGPSSNTK